MRSNIRVKKFLTIVFAISCPIVSSNASGAIPADYYLVAVGTSPGSTVSNADDNASGAAVCTLRDATEIVTAGTTTGPVNGCDITPIGAPDPGSPVYVINYPAGLIYTIDMVSLRDEIDIAFNPVHIVGSDPATDIIQGDSAQPLGFGSRIFNFFQSNSTLYNLTLRYGDGRGREGATLINRAGELTLSNVRVYGSRSTAAGAGLANTFSGIMNILAGSVIGDPAEPNRIVGTLGAFGGAGILNWNSTMLIEDSTVHYNTTDQQRDGGGIYNASGSLTIRDSIVANNSLTAIFGADGAGIYISSNSEVTIDGGHIHSNTTSSNGGAIYADFNSQLDVGGGVIIGGLGTPNHASEGGGIYNREFFDDGYVRIADAEISHNTTVRGGGGIFNNAGQLDIGAAGSATIICNNVAGSINGGGIVNQGGVVNITDTTIADNEAIGGFGRGGGIYNSISVGSGSALLSVINSVVTSNAARFGGGIFNVGAGAIATLDAAVVSSNTTLNSAGGGVVNFFEAQMIIQNGSVIGGMGNGNLAGFAGGGIANFGSHVVISDSEISHNSASDGNGGGIYNVAYRNTSTDEVIPSMLSINNSWVAHNQAVNGGIFDPDGGGVFNDDSRLIIIDTTVAGNGAASEGGGLVNQDGTISISGSNIVGNVANGNGAGLFNQTKFGFGTKTTSTEIFASVFLDNRSQGNGGAIFNEVTIFGKAAEVTVSSSRIGETGGGNEATLGGAIYNGGTEPQYSDDARVTVTGSFIESNNSGVHHSDATTRVNYSCIDGNGFGFVNATPGVVQNARDNWWGAPDGPSDLGGSTATGSGDGVTGGVDFAGFSDRGCIIDSEGGFITGGGWFDSPGGAFLANTQLTGQATFGFAAKHNKGKSVPNGNAEFHFRAGDLKFKSTAYEWLIVSGARGMFKGSGTINQMGNYGFQLTVIDAALTPSTDADLFRIKIWDKSAADAIVYDNGLGAPDGVDPTTALSGGSIVIHRVKK